MEGPFLASPKGKDCRQGGVLGWDGWTESSIPKTLLELAEELAEVWKGKECRNGGEGGSEMSEI